MKRIILVLFLVCSSSFVAFAQKAPDFNSLINANYAAWSTLNADNADRFYAKDANLVFFDLAPLKYDGGWKQYHDMFMKGMAPTFSSLSITSNHDLKVTRSGNIAIGTLTFHLKAMQKNGTPVEFDGRHTVVWQERGGKWLIIHEHVSKPL